MELDKLREDLNSNAPATLAGLLAFHAVRVQQLQNLLATDVHDGRLYICGQRIRFDRILDEARATGGDIRRLIDLFGLSFETASRYAATVNRLARPGENRPGTR